MPSVKRPFILFEIVIAIALLASCALPLISSSMLAFKKRKMGLIELELERQGELLFYQFLKNNLFFVTYDEILQYKGEPKDFEPFMLTVDDQIITYYPHYHLFYDHKNPPGETMTAKCKICISKEKGQCSSPHYKFAFFVKKVAENSADPHGKNKEKSLENHERLPSQLQTIHPSERKSS
ncbi:MAG: hypothetical protein KDK71_06860 [Chlamydiia bacterium]|nr:hypothetical protein [Chlamydiia bacterium]